jgi:hypothetical protein
MVSGVVAGIGSREGDRGVAGLDAQALKMNRENKIRGKAGRLRISTPKMQPTRMIEYNASRFGCPDTPELDLGNRLPLVLGQPKAKGLFIRSPGSITLQTNIVGVLAFFLLWSKIRIENYI